MIIRRNVFNVWAEATLPVWPRDAQRLGTPRHPPNTSPAGAGPPGHPDLTSRPLVHCLGLCAPHPGIPSIRGNGKVMPLDLFFPGAPSSLPPRKSLHSFLPPAGRSDGTFLRTGDGGGGGRGIAEVKREVGVIGPSTLVPQECRTGCAGSSPWGRRRSGESPQAGSHRRSGVLLRAGRPASCRRPHLDTAPQRPGRTRRLRWPEAESTSSSPAG